MIRKTYVILLIIGFLLASCSPETVKQMPKEEIEESSTMAVATASGEGRAKSPRKNDVAIFQ